MSGVVDPFVRPQRTDGHDAVIDLAHRPDLLPSDMVRVGARLAIAGVIDDQHAVGVRSRGRIADQECQALLVDCLSIPA